PRRSRPFAHGGASCTLTEPATTPRREKRYPLLLLRSALPARFLEHTGRRGDFSSRIRPPAQDSQRRSGASPPGASPFRYQPRTGQGVAATVSLEMCRAPATPAPEGGRGEKEREIVGWVERSEAHQGNPGVWWASLRSTHPTQSGTGRPQSRGLR